MTELHFFSQNSVAEIGRDGTGRNHTKIAEAADAYTQRWSDPTGGADEQRVRFEITPSYMMERRSAWAMALVLNHMKVKAKIVFVLRNPVKRA